MLRQGRQKKMGRVVLKAKSPIKMAITSRNIYQQFGLAFSSLLVRVWSLTVLRASVMIFWLVFGLVIHFGSGGLLSSYRGQYVGKHRYFQDTARARSTSQNPGERLFLTPYIKDGEIMRARELSRVTPFLGTVESYSGFLTIDKDTNSNMFFWFFPAENNPHDAPIALWLQGGPGAPSVDAVFTENGPFVINDSLELERRSSYWSQEINMIYIDNPVGTGFSFTDTGYVTDETEVGRDLYKALIQFFQLFPEWQENDFYITGESYAGKYIPAIAYTIHTKNPSAFQKINLKGIAIGDGLVDPENMMVYGEYLYQHGLIDSQGLKGFNEIEAEVVSLIQKGRYTDAFRSFDKLLNGDLFKYPTLFYNTTGLKSYFNYATANLNVDNGGSQDAWLAKPEHRRSLHVGDQKFDEGSKVEKYLLNDIMQSVRPWLEVLMENYRVLLYNGEFDIICAYPLTMNYVKKLQWSGKKEYEKAERKFWYVNNELAGFVKTAGNFTEVLVRNAGHMVPGDQPLWALDLITKFTQNIPF